MSTSRLTDSIYLQYIWDALDILTSSNQTRSFDNILAFIRTHKDPKCDAAKLQCELSSAIKDQCISITNHDYFRVDLTSSSEKKAKHDWYCFECHLPGHTNACPTCFRVLHRNCLESCLAGLRQNAISNELEEDLPAFYRDNPPCPVCTWKKNIRLSFEQSKDLAKILSVLHERLKSKPTWRLLNQIGYLNDPVRNKYLVFQEMNTKMISQKLREAAYRNRSEIMFDMDILVHNTAIIYGSKAEMCNTARQVRTMLRKELKESSFCSDCYLNADLVSKNSRITLACRKTHKLVWYQHNGWSFWPMKVLNEDEAGYEVISFGGRHDRSYVPKDRTTDFSFSLAHDFGLRMTPALKKALDEVKEYQANQIRLTDQIAKGLEPTHEMIRSFLSSTNKKSSSKSRKKSKQGGTLAQIDREEDEDEDDEEEEEEKASTVSSATTTLLSLADSKKITAFHRDRRKNNNATVNEKCNNNTNNHHQHLSDSLSSLSSSPNEEPAEEEEKLKVKKKKKQQKKKRPKPSIHTETEGKRAKKESPLTSPNSRLLFAAASQAACSYNNFWTNPLGPETLLRENEEKAPQRAADESDDSSCSDSSSSSSSVGVGGRFSSGPVKLESVVPPTCSKLFSSGGNSGLDSGFNSTYPNMGSTSTNSSVVSPLPPSSSASCATRNPKVATVLPSTSSLHSPKFSNNNSNGFNKNASLSSVSPAALSSASSSGLGSSLCGDPKSVDASPGSNLGIAHPIVSSGGSALVASTTQILSSMAATLPAQTPEAKLRRELEEAIHAEYAERISRLSRDRDEARDEISRLERTIHELRRKHETELRATKQRCWCHVCLKEAYYHCCAGVSYCSQTCQLEHWTAQHSRECKRANQQSSR